MTDGESLQIVVTQKDIEISKKLRREKMRLGLSNTPGELVLSRLLRVKVLEGFYFFDIILDDGSRSTVRYEKKDGQFFDDPYTQAILEKWENVRPYNMSLIRREHRPILVWDTPPFDLRQANGRVSGRPINIVSRSLHVSCPPIDGQPRVSARIDYPTLNNPGTSFVGDLTRTREENE